MQIKNVQKIFIIALLFFFLGRFFIGLETGIQKNPGAKYFEIAQKCELEKDFSPILFNLSPNSLFVKPWLLILTLTLFIFNNNLLAVIILSSLVGTLSIYLFYRMINIFFPEKTALLTSILLALLPLHIKISANPVYDGFYLCLTFYHFENYFKFIREDKIKYLIIAGMVGSLMMLIHGSINMFFAIAWFIFPFIHNSKKWFHKWLLLLFLVAVFPVTQMIIWKFTSGTFLPDVNSEQISITYEIYPILAFICGSSIFLLLVFLWNSIKNIPEIINNKYMLSFFLPVVFFLLTFLIISKLNLIPENFIYLQVFMLTIICYFLKEKTRLIFPILTILIWLPTLIMIVVNMVTAIPEELMCFVLPFYGA